MFVKNLIFCAAKLLYWTLVRTVRVRLHGFDVLQTAWQEGKGGFVLCCPHHFILSFFVGLEASRTWLRPMTLLVSLSKDGDWVPRLVNPNYFCFLRGSSRHGAVNALIQMKKLASLGKDVGLAFDGPLGPPLEPKRGLLSCLQSAKGPAVFVHGTASGPLSWLWHPFRLSTWDRFLVLVPFCTIDLKFEILQPPADEAQPYEWVLKQLEYRSRQEYGYLYSKNTNSTPNL